MTVESQPIKRIDPVGWLVVPGIMIGILFEVAFSLVFDRPHPTARILDESEESVGLNGVRR